MSEAKKTSQPLWRKLCFGFVVLLCLLALALFALRVFVTTSAGHRFLEYQINTRSFGPIESMSVSHLSGDPLGDLKIGSIAVSDKEGVWLKASDIRIEWALLSLFTKHIDIKRAAANQVTVRRRPALEFAESSGAIPQISAPKIAIASLSIDPDILGQVARFSLNSGFIFKGDKTNLNLKLVRSDASGEVLELDIDHLRSGDVKGTFSLRAPSGGPIAALLRVPNGMDVIGTGEVSGTQSNGDGQISIHVGKTEAVEAALNWTPKQGSVDARASLDAWPEFAILPDIFGSKLSVSGRVERNLGERPFEFRVLSPQADISAKGIMPIDSFKVASASIKATVAAPSRLGLLPKGYSAGPTSLSGVVSMTPVKFDGRVKIVAPTTPYGQASTLSGPVSLSQAQDKTFAFKTALTAQGLSLSRALPVDLENEAVLSATGRYNTAARRLNLTEAILLSGTQSATSSGRLQLSPLAYKLAGDLNLKLNTFDAVGPGQLSASYAIAQQNESGPALTAQGRFQPKTAFAAPLDVLLGKAIKFETQMLPISGGVKISSAQLFGKNVRAAFEGTVSEQLALSGEALTTTRFTFGSTEVGERAEVSLKIDGQRASPNIKLQSSVSGVNAAGQSLENITLKADISDVIRSPLGAIVINGESDYGAVQVQAVLSSKDRDITIADLMLDVGDVSASGDLVYSERGLFTGEVALNLPESGDSFARASLSLSEDSGTSQGVRASIAARNVNYQAFDIDAINLDASGTLSNLAGDITVKGRRKVGAFARPIEITAPFGISRDDAGTIMAEFDPNGRYASLDFAAREAVSLKFGDETISFKALMTLMDEPIDVNYARRLSSSGAPQERLKMSANNLPISLFPLPGNLADSRGSVSLEADFQSEGQSALGGDAVLRINDWRGFGIDAGEGVSLVFTTKGFPQSLNTVLEGKSSSGFSLNGNLAVPLNAGIGLSTMRPDMNARIEGRLRAAGPAESLLGLITPPSADLGGRVDLSIDVAGNLSAPNVVGKASGQALQFETPELGTQIRNGRFNASFNNTELNVSDIYFTDARDGVVKGGGQFTLGEFGRPIGQLSVETSRFNVIDRRDVSARISGNVRYQSEPKSATISGTIKVGEAELKQIKAGNDVSVIEIDVEEFNRPDGLNQKVAEDRPKVSTNLDIKINAPRRIFVRSRGLDVELSANITLKGILDDPIVQGSAEVERGSYKIAGKELKFTEGSVRFDGPIGDARVSLKANAQTSNLNASVSIDGTVADPEIELSSSPDRPDDEILSALLFGRSATELSALEAAQLAGALAQFSGNGIGFDLLGGLRDSIGIGQLNVGVSEDGNAQITGGRYLARNVYLQVFSGVGSEQTGAIIDWELRKNISLRSRIQADNDQSLSLSYKYDF